MYGFRKLLLLIIPFFLFSCNDDDGKDYVYVRKDDTKTEKPFDYNIKQKGLPAPPQWLKGKWEIVVEPTPDDPYRNKKDIIEVTNYNVFHNGESFKEKFKDEEILADVWENSYSGKTGKYIFYVKSNGEKGSKYIKYSFWYWSKSKFSLSIRYVNEKGRNIDPPIRKVREYKRMD